MFFINLYIFAYLNNKIHRQFSDNVLKLAIRFICGKDMLDIMRGGCVIIFFTNVSKNVTIVT